MLAGHLFLDLRVGAVLLDQVLLRHHGIMVAGGAVVIRAVRLEALGKFARGAELGHEGAGVNVRRL